MNLAEAFDKVCERDPSASPNPIYFPMFVYEKLNDEWKMDLAKNGYKGYPVRFCKDGNIYKLSEKGELIKVWKE